MDNTHSELEKEIVEETQVDSSPKDNGNNKRTPVRLTDEIGNPEPIHKPFLAKKGFKSKVAKALLGDSVFQTNLKEPCLILMKNNGFMEILEGVQPGEFIIATDKGEKSIMLSPNKIHTLKYNETFIKTWVAYEDSASPYPEDPLHTADMQRKITQKLAMNWRDRDEYKDKLAIGKMWMYIIIAAALGIFIIFSIPGIKEFFIGGGGEAAAQIAKTAIQNATINSGATVIP